MIDEQSSVSGHDYASDRSAIGAGEEDIVRKIKRDGQTGGISISRSFSRAGDKYGSNPIRM